LTDSADSTTAAKTPHTGATLIFALTVFTGAFLLFQVQPLIGKFITPAFGGGPEVWTTCMLAFQTLLLAGYAYAHLTATLLRPSAQAGMHIAVLAAAIVTLPIVPSASFRPDPLAGATIQVLLVLGATVAVPFFALSATGPLLQRWFIRTGRGKSPYRLYALSNAGSLLALVSYPLLFEPLMSRGSQASLWSAGLGAFALLCAVCALLQWRAGGEEVGLDRTDQAKPGDKVRRPTTAVRIGWLALAAVASVELLAVTNKICLDVAAVPFLWVLPLSLYLLSFVICFDHQRWYRRRTLLIAFVICLVVVAMAKAHEEDLSAVAQIVIHSVTLFVCCMLCHGELFRLRPHPKHLTGYYLLIASGGALGGFLVAVVAPLAFDSYRELHLALLACCMCLLLTDKSPALQAGGRKWIYASLILFVGLLAVLYQDRHGSSANEVVMRTRNFFGVLTVWDNDAHDPEMHRRVLQHGTTFHGLQFAAPDKRLLPTAYYGPDSGVGLLMRTASPDRPRRIGVVGLGVGTIATYCTEGDLIRFYEINPAVTSLAKTRFSYLSSCRANVEVVHGDARLSMESQRPQNYDVLVLDAFASDAVPVHLLTTEAFEIYLRHLAPGGVIAVHISTVHVDLQPVVCRLAEHFQLSAAWIGSFQNELAGVFASDWILLGEDTGPLAHRKIRYASGPIGQSWRSVDLWTDDHVNMLQALRW